MTEHNDFMLKSNITTEPVTAGVYPLPTAGADGRIRVYFADKELLFTLEAAPEGYYAVSQYDDTNFSRAKIITFLGNYNKVAIICDDIQQAFDRLADEFIWVEAAGGVVKNSSDAVVMICRNNRWDLPKGHREEGESMVECAVREVAEETGVKVSSVERFLCATIHCYNLYGKWEMKYTSWYDMSTSENTTPVPQAEEGIVAAEWVARDMIEERIKRSYPTIKSVFAAFLK